MKTKDSLEKIVAAEALLALRGEWRRQGRKLVWTNGCFDVLHVGHIRNLRAAAALGDILIVGLNSDASVRRLKGPTRPVIVQEERAETLAALGCVDYVCIFDDDSPAALLAQLQPDIFCKGAQFEPPHGPVPPEASTIAAYGGAIRYLTMAPDRSTTGLLKRIASQESAPRSCSKTTP